MRSFLSKVLLLAGGGALIWCAVVWIVTASFESYQARRWADLPPAPSANEAARAPVTPKPHDVIAWLEVPRLRISTAVIEGDDDLALQLGAGHIPGTPLPGAIGNIGIAAHRDSFFRSLSGIRAHDRIRLRTKKGEWVYTVESTRIVPPSNVSVLANSGESELTLVTCYPFRYVGPAPLRFIVQAHRTASNRL